MLQHVGAPSVPVVKAKDEVAFGDIVCKSGGFVSAPLHAPIAGKVLKSAVTTLPNGRHVPVVDLESTMQAAADHYRSLKTTSNAALAVIAISMAMLGMVLVRSRIKPGLRARNMV